jgi:hypothetical protein
MPMGGIVACQAGNIFACRSNRRSVLQLDLIPPRIDLSDILLSQ